MTLSEILIQLLRAESDPKQFFGLEPDKVLRQWHSLSHPDRFSNKSLAQEYFTRFTAAFEKLNKKLPILSVKGKEYQLSDSPIIGDTSDVHINETIVKIGRLNSRSIEFAKNEQECLATLRKSKFDKYLPNVLDRDRQVSIIELRPGFTRFSDLPKLPGVHIAWLTRRLLEIVGFAHKQGITHGGIVPDNILVFKKTHGIHLIDWKFGGKEKVNRSKKFSFLYPNDEKVTPATDIYMICSTLSTLFGNVEPKLVRFYRGCMQERAAMRPNDAWVLYDEFSDLIKKLYGPPKFVELL